ncbi:MAG: geranylgeranylglycerol-phosphate geranylgeranyltransferase [candidate division Zixibacteria bacterium]|nr:geranylgeranylglycerol-phosphate geranylgeranyltransferase [candidate division Zixibacteria bacterium]MCI0596087.1 geranylgeranylglycerol-phosphate geranylgeranyltransferase [candidate division Zixibacteria bacterium]
MINRFWAFARLGRVWNGALVAASVLIGAFFAAGGESQPIAWINSGVYLGCLSAFLIATGAYALNDFFDWKIDKINKPTRPLPAGELSGPAASFFGFLSVLTGIVFAYFINPKSFFAAFISGLLVVQYAMIFKRVMIIGHVVTAFLSSFGFLFGAWASGYSGFRLPLYAFVFGFLFHLGREFLKGAEDREADLQQGAKTLAVLTSAKLSVQIAALILTLLAAVAWLPFFTEGFNWIYLVLVILGIDLVLFFSLYRALSNPVPAVLCRVNRYLKFSMAAGLLALWLGKL